MCKCVEMTVHNLKSVEKPKKIKQKKRDNDEKVASHTSASAIIPRIARNRCEIGLEEEEKKLIVESNIFDKHLNNDNEASKWDNMMRTMTLVHISSGSAKFPFLHGECVFLLLHLHFGDAFQTHTHPNTSEIIFK